MSENVIAQTVLFGGRQRFQIDQLPYFLDWLTGKSWVGMIREPVTQLPLNWIFCTTKEHNA